MSLSIRYQMTFGANRATTQEAINWCFDNCESDFRFNHIHDSSPCREVGNWASFEIVFTTDRDAVLFKTFWNDR